MRAEAKDVLVAFVIFALLITVVVVLWVHVLAATLALILLWATSLFFWRDKRDIITNPIETTTKSRVDTSSGCRTTR